MCNHTHYVQDRINSGVRELTPKKEAVWPAYVGRGPMASTAEGYGQAHSREQARILAEALQEAPIGNSVGSNRGF